MLCDAYSATHVSLSSVFEATRTGRCRDGIKPQKGSRGNLIRENRKKLSILNAFHPHRQAPFFLHHIRSFLSPISDKMRASRLIQRSSRAAANLYRPAAQPWICRRCASSSVLAPQMRLSSPSTQLPLDRRWQQRRGAAAAAAAM